jgi:hypothetical protein
VLTRLIKWGPCCNIPKGLQWHKVLRARHEGDCLSEFTSIANYVYNTYVAPAFLNGKEKVTIRVHEVLHGLDNQFGLVAVHRVLGSEKFRASLSLPVPGDQAVATPESHLPSEYDFDLKPLLSQRAMSPSAPCKDEATEEAGKSGPGQPSSDDSNAGSLA